jgi:hypothetical protein
VAGAGLNGVPITSRLTISSETGRKDLVSRGLAGVLISGTPSCETSPMPRYPERHGDESIRRWGNGSRESPAIESRTGPSPWFTTTRKAWARAAGREAEA